MLNTENDGFIPLKQNTQQEITQKRQFFLKIRGVPYKCNKNDLIGFFDLESLKKENIAMRYLKNGLFSGECYIQVESINDYEEIKKFHKGQMDHRYLEIFNSSFDEYQQAQDSKLYLKDSKSNSQNQLNENNDFDFKHAAILKLRGLPYNCNENDIRSFLQNNNKIQEIKMINDDQGKSKGFCFVIVSNLDVAEKIKKQYHKKYLGQRYIEIFICSSREYQQQQNRSRSRSNEK